MVLTEPHYKLKVHLVITANDLQVKIASPENVEKVTDVSEEQRHKVGARLLPSNNLEWTMKMDKVSSDVCIFCRLSESVRNHNALLTE